MLRSDTRLEYVRSAYIHLLTHLHPDASPKSLLNTDESIEREVKKLIGEVEPAMQRLVRGELNLPTWTPSDEEFSPEALQHIEKLNIPCVKGKPNLLLHDLGSFKLDEKLGRRLANIFMPYNHT